MIGPLQVGEQQAAVVLIAEQDEGLGQLGPVGPAQPGDHLLARHADRSAQVQRQRHVRAELGVQHRLRGRQAEGTQGIGAKIAALHLPADRVAGVEG
ncbi:MAG: hypothetical protein HGA45_01005 [Chloroflexales bacterium]|nr:hypothetical protein [Chloroflexales bacterium]